MLTFPALETAYSLLPKSSGSGSPEWWRRECAGEAGRSQRNRSPAGCGLAAEIGGKESAVSITARNRSAGVVVQGTQQSLRVVEG